MPASPKDLDVGILGLRIEYDYKDDPKHLAMRLGELYSDLQTFDREAQSYAEQANAERTKAVELRDVLAQIEADPSRDSLIVINPATGLPRRMNPFKEYSVDAMLEQLLTHDNRAIEFDQTAAGKRGDLSDAREEIKDVQLALERLKSAD